MILLSFFMAFLSAFLQSGQSTKCGEFQTFLEGRCCDLCGPGTYMESACSQNNPTRCRPCEDGSYADKHNTFDRCEKCMQCQKEFHLTCNTTSATCLCQPGFLCSNSTCSVCVENKCTIAERPKKTEHPSGQYSYQCEPKCPGYQYFNSTEGTCKPWTLCSAIGLVEKIPGNEMHDSVCQTPERQKHRGDRDSMYIILCLGFVLLSFALFIFVSYTCWKNIRKQAANKRVVQAVCNKTSDFHLSQEESGLQLQYELKDSSSLNWLDKENLYSLQS